MHNHKNITVQPKQMVCLDTQKYHTLSTLGTQKNHLSESVLLRNQNQMERLKKIVYSFTITISVIC